MPYGLTQPADEYFGNLEEQEADPTLRYIEGFPRYFVSVDGEVYYQGSPYPESEYINPRGDPYVSIYDENFERTTRLVRVLVARAFVDNPSPAYDTVMQLDTNRRNCHAENLKWTTRSRAVLYRNQFKRDEVVYVEQNTPPVYNQSEDTYYDSVFDIAITHGWLFRDVHRRIMELDRDPAMRGTESTPIMDRLFFERNTIHV